MASPHPHARVEFRTPRFASGAEVEAHLSWLQSRMSAERTLMSLVRFGTTLIALGFTIVEYVAHLMGSPPGTSAVRPETAEFFGLSMIGGGVALLIIGLYQYHVLITYLWSAENRPLAGIGGDQAHTWATVGIAMLLIVTGIVAGGATLLRLT